MFIIKLTAKDGEHVLSLQTAKKGQARIVVIVAQENNLLPTVTMIPEQKEVPVKFEGIETPGFIAPSPAEKPIEKPGKS